MKKNCILFLLIIISFTNFRAQDSINKDSIKLPFTISSEKKLSDEDLANKKEGTYITGVPGFTF